MHRRRHVARTVQFLEKPRSVEALGEARQARVRIVRGEGVKDGLRGQHTGLHGRVRTLHLELVQKAGIVPDQHAAGEGGRWQGLQAALDDGPGAIGDALAARQCLGDGGMVLEALELVKGAQMRVPIRQIHDEPHRNLAVLLVVEEPAATGAGGGVAQWPAQRVDHAPRHMALRRRLPQFLQPDAVMLCAGGQAMPRDELLAQVAAAALGEQREAPAQLVARLKSGLALPGRRDASVSGGDAHHAITVVEHVRCREAGEHVHAQLLGPFPHPTAQIAEADGVLADVAQVPRDGEAGHLQTVHAIRQVIPQVLRDRCRKGRSLVRPVRQQLVQRARLEHRARQDVGTDFGAFLDQANRHFAPTRLA